MKIKPEVSSVVRTLTTPSNNAIPIVDTTQAETEVMVKDGTTIIIGGLRKDEKSETVQKIPFLSDLPLIGNAFKNVDRDVEQTELIVFLTPHIIEGDESVAAADGNPLDLKGTQAYPDPGTPGTASPKASASPILIDPQTGKVIDLATPAAPIPMVEARSNPKS
jgi:type II secretory pathway component GspD/PulD (secretin)